MRAVTSTQEDALAQTVTRPGRLVEFALLDGFLRICSRGTVNALGVEWTKWGFQDTGFGLDQGRPSPSGQIVLNDPNYEMSALLLNAPAGVPVKLYRFTVEALAEDEDDVILVFDGVTGDIAGDAGNAALTIACISKENALLFTPRRNVSTENGFGVIIPNGTLTLNGEKWRLEPEA